MIGGPFAKKYRDRESVTHLAKDKRSKLDKQIGIDLIGILYCDVPLSCGLCFRASFPVDLFHFARKGRKYHAKQANAN